MHWCLDLYLGFNICLTSESSTLDKGAFLDQCFFNGVEAEAADTTVIVQVAGAITDVAEVLNIIEALAVAFVTDFFGGMSEEDKRIKIKR